MRTLVRVALVLIVLLVVAVAALAFALPSIVDSADLRGRFDRIARDSIGRSLDYGEVELGILPPRLDVSDLVVGGATPDAEPALRAGRAALSLAWGPLFSGEAVVDALVIESAELRVVRTAEGIDLPTAASSDQPQGAPTESEGGGAPPISLRRISLRDSRIVFDDRVATPPLVWQLERVRLDATGGVLDDPIDFEFAAAIESGGALRGSGRAELEGKTEAEIELDGFPFSRLASYVEALDRIDGRGDIDVALVRAADGTLDLDVSASSDTLDAASGGHSAAGALAVTAQLRMTDDGVIEGPFDIDLTRAVLDLAEGSLRKESGEPGSLKGRVRLDDGGTTSDFHLQLRNLGADAKLRTAPSLRVELAVPAFALDGWETTVPALADYSPRGELLIEQLVYTSEPDRVTGSAELRGLVVEPGDGTPPVELSGFVDANGRDAVVRDMFASTGSARFGVEGGLRDLFGAQDLKLRLNTLAPIESNDVFSMVDSLRDAIFGALALDLGVDLALSGVAAEQPLLERLNGDFSFQIGGDEAGGRLQGVSLLKQAFERFGALGHAALFALPAKRGKSLDDYYSEQFQEFAGSFVIENGEARTDDLHIIYDKYRTNLRGGLRLADLALDMRGEIVIGSELDAALSGADTGSERTIPLARVGGTVHDPTISLDSGDVSRFVARYALGGESKIGQKLDKKIDKALGQGASDLLRGVLGGAARK